MTTPSAPRRRLSQFTGSGYDKGRGRPAQVGWMLASSLVTMRWWCPPSLRARILRGFGAKIGSGTNIRHGVRIHWPWKLEVGDDSWIGEGAYLLNLEPITIGSDVCISQQAMLCTGSHDARSPSFEFDNAPITVRDGAWIATRATVLRGVTVGRDAVVGATALVTADVPDGARVLAPRAADRTDHSGR
ncbi:colanic acid biosynthesis acetyltransferase WcaF [Paraoerskovia sediminicola]|uniref:Colanic acid biosynthesis acetyltransferase WcaF n=1 Tax=Paraoerskovia sediminicola TaxID=1138587 RepID=A0ABM8G3M7_9CELL|nr:putative colanic acid biosynthesis acetyltransferase [Paraoerskovia sediminicola]BDZ42744.1 colanic acid biosynthesis acetyltransferase WcaF [Paraoerskovia sediminicola]